VILTGQPGDVQLNEAYTLIFKWGQAGLSMALWNEDGSLLRRVTNVLTDGVTGTSPIRFGLWHDGTSSPHNGPYGRVIWLKRRISDGAEAILARARTIARVTGEYITTPEAHGWSTGNTNTQNTAAFNTAIVNASANAGSSSTGRGVVELMQGKTYVLTTTPGTQSDPHGALLISSNRPNVEIRTQGKPLIGSGNQATLQFESWAGKSGVRRMYILLLLVASNVKIGWLRVNGNKNSCATTESARVTWLLNNMDYSEGGNGAITNILVRGGNNITVEQVESFNALTDGLALAGSNGSTGAPVTNFLMVDCDVHHCRRLNFGMSGGPVGNPNLTWDQIVFRRVKGRFCGDEPGVMPGNRPGQNFLMEPLVSGSTMYGVTLDACEFRDAQGTSFDNELGGVASYAGGRGVASDTHAHTVYFKMINCIAANNTAEAVQLNLRDAANYNHVEIRNLVATGNANNRLGFFDAQSPFEDSRVLDTAIINCNVTSIVFENQLAPTGNSVTIWKGNFNPTVTTNGRATVTVNNGFPS
jgi:hypothetical protein